MTIPVELVMDHQLRSALMTLAWIAVGCVALQTLVKVIECWRDR